QACSVARSSDCKVYWYCALLCRPPTLMSCVARKNRRPPATTDVARRSRAFLAFRQRFQRHEHKAAIGRIAAGEAGDRRHARVLAHDVDELGEFLAHQLERDALVGLDAADQAPRVLLREKSLGDDDIEKDVERDSGEQHYRSKKRVPQRDAE